MLYIFFTSSKGRLYLWTEVEFLDEIQTKVLKEFSSLLFTVTSTALPWYFYFFKLMQPLTFFFISHKTYFHSKVTLHCKEKGGKPDRKPYPLPYGLRIHTETSSLRTLKIRPPENSTKLYVHEFGFSTKSIWIPVTGINIIFIAAVFSKKSLVSTNYYARTYSKCVSNATKLICWKYGTQLQVWNMTQQ